VLGFISHEAPYPTVFIHGAGGNSLLWKRTLQYLSGEMEALAVDLPGHPAGEITCKTVRDYAKVVFEFIVDRGIEKPVVCGHSMGGAVALTLALEHHDELAGMVLASTGAKLGVDPAILDGLLGQPLKAVEQLITPRSFYSLNLSLGREARASLSVSNLDVFLNDYLACQDFDVRADLRRISTRTIIVCGDKDRMTPPKWSHYLNANITNSELRFVKDSGHMLPLEKPEALAGVVQSFLATITP
jgi:pimeloyl-ACP methyl ester carboxylesterase